MVRLAAMVLLMGAGGQSAAQDVDWRRAGGDLFGAPAPDVVELADAEEVARVASLSQPYQALIDQAALAHGLDPKLLHALVVTESAYSSGAVSPAGAGGLAQLMPGTARDLGVRDRFDPADNVRGGANYLAQQIQRFGDLRLALAAYNAGPGRVARLGRVPDIRETREYVDRVLECFLALTAGRAVVNSNQCPARGTL